MMAFNKKINQVQVLQYKKYTHTHNTFDFDKLKIIYNKLKQE